MNYSPRGSSLCLLCLIPAFTLNCFYISSSTRMFWMLYPACIHYCSSALLLTERKANSPENHVWFCKHLSKHPVVCLGENSLSQCGFFCSAFCLLSEFSVRVLLTEEKQWILCKDKFSSLWLDLMLRNIVLLIMGMLRGQSAVCKLATGGLMSHKTSL